MFQGTCHHCGDLRMFGDRHLVGFCNESPGRIALTWRCPSCDRVNTTRTGRAMSTTVDRAPSERAGALRPAGSART